MKFEATPSYNPESSDSSSRDKQKGPSPLGGLRIVDFKKKESPRTQHNKRALIELYGIDPEILVDPIEYRTIYHTLRFAITNRILARNPRGMLILDVGRLRSLTFKHSNSHGSGDYISVDKVLNLLSHLSGFTSEEARTPEFAAGKLAPHPFYHLPETRDDLYTRYGTTTDTSLVKPWEIASYTHWTNDITLESGERTNKTELLVLYFLHKLRARRTEAGILEVWDEHEQSFRRFSTPLFISLTGYNPQKKSGTTDTSLRRRLSFADNPLLFIREYAPDLFRRGVLRESDFQLTGNTATAELFSPHERRLSKHNGFVMFTNASGQTAKYYVGTNYIVGTDIPINFETMRACLLDSETVGIVEYRADTRHLIATFPLADTGEIENQKNRIRTTLTKSGKPFNEGDVSARTTLTGAYMSSRIHRYDPTGFIYRRSDESPDAYADRISDLHDVDRVFNDSRDFFREVNIGIHTLSWHEQLVLSRSIANPEDRERISSLAQRFGIDGLRSLLILDYDPLLVGSVFAIADRLDPEIAQDIFSQYHAVYQQSRAIATLAKNSDFIVASENDPSNHRRFVEEISEALIRRAKDTLVTAATVARAGSATATSFSGARLACTDITDIPRALTTYEHALEIMTHFIHTYPSSDYDFSLIKKEHNTVPVTYHFSVDQQSTGRRSYFSIQLRTYGAPIGQHTSSIEFDGEARINCLFSDVPFSSHISDPARQRALSIRLDREGKERLHNNIISNDPTRPDGEVSLDIGGLIDPHDPSDATNLSRVIAIGNSLQTGTSSQHYHNRDSFSRAFGTADYFAGIVRFVDKKIQERFSPPTHSS